MLAGYAGEVFPSIGVLDRRPRAFCLFFGLEEICRARMRQRSGEKSFNDVRVWQGSKRGWMLALELYRVP